MKGSLSHRRFSLIAIGFLSKDFIPLTWAAPTNARMFGFPSVLKLSEAIQASLAVMRVSRSSIKTRHAKARDANMRVRCANWRLDMSMSQMLASTFRRASVTPMNSHLLVHTLFCGHKAQLEWRRCETNHYWHQCSDSLFVQYPSRGY